MQHNSASGVSVGTRTSGLNGGAQGLYSVTLRKLVSDFTPMVEVTISERDNMPVIEAKLPSDLWRAYASDISGRDAFRRKVEARIRKLFEEQKYAKLVSPLVIEWREHGPDFRLGKPEGADAVSAVFDSKEKKYTSSNVSTFAQGTVLFHALKIYLDELHQEFEGIILRGSAAIVPSAGHEKISLSLGHKSF